MAIEHNPIEGRLQRENANIEDLKNLILTDEQYSHHPFAHAEGPRPYVYRLTNGGKELAYFGSYHISDPEDPLYADIEREFHGANPDMVYVEGYAWANDHKAQAREELKTMTWEKAKQEGESIFILKLASIQLHISISSPPSRRLQTKSIS
jgi:hypothetical protein